MHRWPARQQPAARLANRDLIGCFSIDGGASRILSSGPLDRFVVATRIRVGTFINL
jgi:hypothetical protein